MDLSRNLTFYFKIHPFCLKLSAICSFCIANLDITTWQLMYWLKIHSSLTKCPTRMTSNLLMQSFFKKLLLKNRCENLMLLPTDTSIHWDNSQRVSKMPAWPKTTMGSKNLSNNLTNVLKSISLCLCLRRRYIGISKITQLLKNYSDRVLSFVLIMRHGNSTSLMSSSFWRDTMRQLDIMSRLSTKTQIICWAWQP